MLVIKFPRARLSLLSLLGVAFVFILRFQAARTLYKSKTGFLLDMDEVIEFSWRLVWIGTFFYSIFFFIGLFYATFKPANSFAVIFEHRIFYFLFLFSLSWVSSALAPFLFEVEFLNKTSLWTLAISSLVLSFSVRLPRQVDFEE